MSCFVNKLSTKGFCNILKRIDYKTTTQVYRLSRTNVLRHFSKPSKIEVYLIDEDNVKRTCFNCINAYTYRSYTCGELRSKNVGQTVVLCGWLEYQRMNKFIVLRDSYGETQLILRDQDIDKQKLLETIPYESIIQVSGTVLSRPKDMINAKQPTGEVEVLVDKFTVVNKSKENLPFNIREFQKAKESLRMQYRYLDLRFPQMQRNLRVRSKFLMKMREFLINNHFVDVETPTLFKATPGGAQEFIVPTRFPGQFYSLVQSPQQFKQMLMAGAIDRYFQIARCYRDESARSDRQPEFTQLDIELSFTCLDGVIKLVEELLGYSWPEFLDPIPTTFPRFSYNYVLENYGCDKPDVSFDYKLRNCTDLLRTNKKFAVEEDFGAYYIIFPKEHANLGKQVKELMQKVAKQYPKAKLIQSKVTSCKDWIMKLGKLLTIQAATELVEVNKVQEESVIFMTHGDREEALSLLGRVRLEYVNFLESLGISLRKRGMHFLWIVDFPLFEISKETGELGSAHHPFTAPHPEDMHLIETDPLKVRGLSYDLVLNGNEVAGGSIRIHDPSMQQSILDKLKIGTDKMEHMLEMLESGCPPHGGVALGLDRLLSIILGTTSIRDVIAFPKTFEGKDPLSGAPSAISEKEEKLYHIKSIISDKSNK